MRGWAWRPRGLAGRLVLLLMLALLLGQAVTFWIFADERRLAIEELRQQQVVDRVGMLVRVIEATPPWLHERLVAAAAGPELGLRLTAEGLADHAQSGRERGFARRLALRLGVAPERVRVDLHRRRTLAFDPARWRRHDPEDERGTGLPEETAAGGGDLEERHHWPRPWLALAVAVEAVPGRWVEASLRLERPRVTFAEPALVALLVTAAAIALVAALTARRIARPMRALADAADRLGRGGAAEALPEEGPDEVRRATRAFNEMSERLRRFIGDRTRLLAALGHDLRTPLTALRLRAELVDDDETRERLLETLEEMRRMVEATLAFARDEAASEAAREVDLAALAEGLCEDLRELGRDVTFAGGERLVVALRPVALRRALRNLIENAAAYGVLARVEVARQGGEAVVTVDDDGPGIPADQIERVFEPFVRLEESRSAATGGVGLGLAIARSVARAHGGEVTLTNRPEGGLRAAVRLPLGGGGAVS